MAPATALLASEKLSNSPGGSAVITALEGLYGALQDRHPDLPDCVLITGTGFQGRSQVWGHFRADAWREAAAQAAQGHTVVRHPEMFIAGETLAIGAEHTLAVLLHEAAHALAAVRGIKDTSRGGRYHNRRFLALAEELGLEHATGTPDTTHGLNLTQLGQGTADLYADELATLNQALPLYLDTLQRLGLAPADPTDDTSTTDAPTEPEKPTPERPKSRNNLKGTCGCGRIIRASATVFDGAPIICTECGEPFTPND